MVAKPVRQKRVALPLHAGEDGEPVSFAELEWRANEFLGHEGELSRDAAEKKVRRMLQQCDEMRCALASLQTPPFTPASVRRYKRRQLRRMTPLRLQFWRLSYYVAHVAGFGLIWSGFVGYAGLLAGSPMARSFAWISLGCLFLLGVCLFACRKRGLVRGYTFEHADCLPYPWWGSTPLRPEDRRRIPVSLLVTIKDLERRFPKIAFFVERLLQDLPAERERVPCLLRADLPDGTGYYLGTWAEENSPYGRA